jgi:hypothetical protein
MPAEFEQHKYIETGSAAGISKSTIIFTGITNIW